MKCVKVDKLMEELSFFEGDVITMEQVKRMVEENGEEYYWSRDKGDFVKKSREIT